MPPPALPVADPMRLAEKVIKGEKVRNICQKVVQLAEKGKKR